MRLRGGGGGSGFENSGCLGAGTTLSRGDWAARGAAGNVEEISSWRGRWACKQGTDRIVFMTSGARMAASGQPHGGAFSHPVRAAMRKREIQSISYAKCHSHQISTMDAENHDLGEQVSFELTVAVTVNTRVGNSIA